MITACLIVKNEERVLGPCLESVKPYVSAIIVVDNGSQDNTVNIAKSFGAVVISAPDYNHDAGRNLYLEEVITPWVLVLDADERITPQTGMALHYAVNTESKNISGFDLPWLHYTGKAKWSYIRTMRLFRNHLRYNTQSVHASVKKAAKQSGEIIREIDAPIHHIDILINKRTGKKRERNIRRICEELDNSDRSDDERATLMSYLAMEYIALERFDEAESLLRQAIDVHPKGYPRGILFLAQFFLLQGRLDDAKQAAEQLQLSDYGYQELAPVVLAEVAYRKGDLSQAIALCSDALNWNGSAYHQYLNLAAMLEDQEPAESLELACLLLHANPYLLKPVVYREGEVPNIFSFQLSLLSCTRSPLEHLASAAFRTNKRSLAQRALEAHEQLVRLSHSNDPATLHQSVSW